MAIIGYVEWVQAPPYVGAKFMNGVAVFDCEQDGGGHVNALEEVDADRGAAREAAR